MNRVLYTNQSKDFERNDSKNDVYKLNIDLYNLVQSRRLWFDEIKRKLQFYELIQFKHDEALFFSFDFIKELYLIVYVDDIKTFAFITKLIEELVIYLKSKYEMTNMSEIKFYLDMKLNRSSNKNEIYFS
jgi:hypothetical protein